MKKSTLVVAAAMFGSVSMLPVYAQADLVCYQWSAFPNERYKLNVRSHSNLSTIAEENATGHAVQTGYSVHGKEVGGCGFGTMGAVTGTVIVAKPKSNTTGQTGAHMGLEVHLSRGDGVEDFCRSIEVDCTTSEVSQTPNVWTCQSRNEFDVYHGISTLTKVDEATDPLCSIFEDGVIEDATAMAVTSPAGPASGLRKP